MRWANFPVTQRCSLPTFGVVMWLVEKKNGTTTGDQPHTTLIYRFTTLNLAHSKKFLIIIFIHNNGSSYLVLLKMAFMSTVLWGVKDLSAAFCLLLLEEVSGDKILGRISPLD